MGLLLRLILSVGDALVAVYALLATASLVHGLVRFLVAAPGAIRHDLERWRREHAESPRPLRHVDDEAEDGPPAPPPSPA